MYVHTYVCTYVCMYVRIPKLVPSSCTKYTIGNIKNYAVLLNLNLKFYLAYIQHNTTDTEHMLIMNVRTPVITKIVDASGRPLK